MEKLSSTSNLATAELDAKVSAELEALNMGLNDFDMDEELVFEVMAQRCPPSLEGDPLAM